MKKLLITLLLTTTAFASGVEFEYGSETYTQAPHIRGPKATNNHFTVTPSIEYKSFGLGLNYEINRDTAKGSPLQSMLEAQISHDLFTVDRFTTSAQIGVGRIINEKDGDYSHYQFTVEEDIKITDKLVLTTSYRYRNAFNNIYYFESNTGKIGFSYRLANNIELGMRQTNKFGAQQHAHGFEGGFVFKY